MGSAMQTLSVLSVEDGAIIVASPAGERFRLPVDATLRARLTAPVSQGDEKRLSPREIQAHIRSGLTAEQVAAMTGVPVAFIERFVGPVLAERAYIVESALAVRLPPETEGARARTFAAVMGERLDALAAKDVHWSSAKEPSGWILAVSFVADDVAHSARWRFDAKHMRLDPDNVEASTLSQQGVPAALTPRLRAIEPTAPVTIVAPAATETSPIPMPPQVARPPHGARVAPEPAAEQDRTRFDSAVFRFPPMEQEPAAKGDRGQHTATGATAQAAPTAPQRAGSGTERSGGDQSGRDQSGRDGRRPAPEVTTDTAALPVTRAMDVVERGEVFAPRPSADRRPAPTAQPTRREPAPIHRLPVRAPDPEPTTPVPPAFTRVPTPQPTRPLPGAPASGRPQAPAPRSIQERQGEPGRRRRDRGRGGFTQLEPVAAHEDVADDQDVTADTPVPVTRPRRGRTSMPSWDEIVFGRDEP